LSDLAKFPSACGVARPLCDSWASYIKSTRANHGENAAAQTGKNAFVRSSHACCWVL